MSETDSCDSKTINISDDSIVIVHQDSKKIKPRTKSKSKSKATSKLKTKFTPLETIDESSPKIDLDPDIIAHHYTIIKKYINEFYNKYIDYNLQDNNINENNKANKIYALNELNGFELITDITTVDDLEKKIKNKYVRILWSRYLWNLKLTPLYKCISISTVPPYKIKLFNFNNYFDLTYPDNEDFLIFTQL
jgi:hypothetical protein